jgi:c-di-GMP-binding flagellar brake protein YcgR
VLKSARTAPCNRRAVAVAIVDGQTGLRSAFDMGAHFVLYKPISAERAKTSFRAARALMKCERRRNLRVPIEMQVTLTISASKSGLKTTATDLGEGGMAVRLTKRPESGTMYVTFILPGSRNPLECPCEIAWENGNGQAGLRFTNQLPSAYKELKKWVSSRLPEGDIDDPPASCKLTDLTPGGCYLEIASPFPARTRVVLSMRLADLEIQVEGVVRVMHPDSGMGVEFTQRTDTQREQVEKFITALMNSGGVIPELLVEPQGLEPEPETSAKPDPSEYSHDSLLELFYNFSLTPDAFMHELRKQRRAQPAAETSTPA